MIENIWDELEEKTTFKQKNKDIKPWDLDKREFNLHDLHIWIEEDSRQNLNCFYDFAKERNELQNISTSNEPTDNENIKNKNAFEDFVKTNLENPQFKNKFVAFVDGEFQNSGDKRNALIEKMYDKFGNVDMYVDKVTDQKKVVLIDTPEFN